MGVECSWDTLKDEDFKPGDRQYCKVDSSEFLTDNCTEANNYGYPQGTPCVLLKLNKVSKHPYTSHCAPMIIPGQNDVSYSRYPNPIPLQIYGWNPKPYDKKKKLPENAPKSLKDFVTKWETDHADRVGHMVWLSCEGENPADVENIGEIKYFPYPGIPTYYFPFNNQKDYKSPIVMAHLTAPKSKLNLLSRQ